MRRTEGMANRNRGLTEGKIQEMTRERIDQIHRCLEAFYATDNSDVASEKTELIEELLTAVKALMKELAEAYTKSNVSVE